jgi:hypothetical protein
MKGLLLLNGQLPALAAEAEEAYAMLILVSNRECAHLPAAGRAVGLCDRQLLCLDPCLHTKLMIMEAMLYGYLPSVDLHELTGKLNARSRHQLLSTSDVAPNACSTSSIKCQKTLLHEYAASTTLSWQW